MQLPEHGANSSRLYEVFGLSVPDEVLDFSENCNPAGPPALIVEAWPYLITKLMNYPDPDGQPFKAAAAQFHGVSERQVLVGNGAAELLSLLAGRYRGKRVVLIDPAFSEYRATLEANGAEVVSVQASEAEDFKLPIAEIEKALSGAAAIYLCTPNNPTGILPSVDELLAVIITAKSSGTEVVLDEAFIDFVDENYSFIQHLEAYPHVIVVRSMTKMYAIPGIRLGYMVAHPEIIADVKRQAPHWNVNGLAAEIGVLCLQEASYREQAIQYAEVERLKMVRFLRAHDCKVIDSAANYLLFKPQRDTRELYRNLLEQGMVLRHTENFLGLEGKWLRVGMKSETMMERLREAMTKWLKAQ